MKPADFQRLRQAFQQLLDARPEERALELARATRDDPAFGAELAAWMAAADEGAAEWLEQPAILGLEEPEDSAESAVAEPPVPERVGPWRVEAEIGRGGMGSVFRGRRDDGAFEQTVAIKLVRSELASEVLRRRFLAERRILAGLEHPNIAHLIDGSTTAEGVPYLVLEHVAGEPIDRYCDRHASSVEERLRLFTVVCAAVGFAHQKLVLHRDIKTANVLVDETGRPKLLDFGIAKLLEPTALEEDWTALGVAQPLTPEWASPEQLRGDPLTTASDVYSLGVLLHVLLTGRRPHRFARQTPAAFARDIEQSPVGKLLSPSSGDAAGFPPGVDPRRLRGDLQRIVARALAPEVGHRYGAVAELATDIERYLAGLPVSAHPASARYRFGKFVRRHRGAVGAVAVAAASLIAATAVSLRQAHIADQQRARAERRFADLRRLANIVLFDVHDALENVAGAMTARRLLVDNALRYLDDLAREAGNDPNLLNELAVGYERIGEVQGMPGWPSEGRTGDALASFERALEIARRSQTLTAVADTSHAAGAVPVDSAAEARLLMRIGSVLAARGDTGTALIRHREALALLEHRFAQTPAGATPPTAIRLELAQAQVAVGDDVWELGDVPEAALTYRDALATSRAALSADPASPLAIRQVGVVEQRLGDAAAETGGWAQAVEHHGASLAVDQKLSALQPADVEIRRDLGTDLSRLAVDHMRQGDAADALDLHRQAMELRQRLLREEPQDARAAEDLAESHLEAGKALAALGRTAEAAGDMSSGIGLWRGLIVKDSRNVRWSDALAAGLSALGDLEARRGERDLATAHRTEAIAIRRRLAADSPDFAANRTALADLEKQLGTASETH